MDSTTDKISTFFKEFPTSTFPKGHLFMSSGEKSQFFYFIENGAVKMTHTTKDGRNIVLHLFFPKAFFSLITLAYEGKNQYDFTSLVGTTVRKVPTQEMISFLKSDVEVLYDLQLRLLKGMSGLLNRLEQTSLATAHDQIISLLVYFAAHFSEVKTDSKIHIKITHQEIADWFGLSRENVSLQMKVLENEGLINIEERIILIPDLALLTSKLHFEFI